MTTACVPPVSAFDPRSIPARYSFLKELPKSAQHYRHMIEAARPDTAGMRTGRLVHWHVLGGMPDDEDGRVVIYDGERRGNAWKDFAAANVGNEIVTRKEWDQSLPIAEAVLANPHAAKLLEGSLFEQPIQWQVGGRACSSRLDILRPGAFLGDLKTTLNSSPRKFLRQAWEMSYHVQLAFYQDAAAFLGIKCPAAHLIAVEVRAPYAVTVFDVSPRVLEEGRRAYRGWLETLRVCEENDFWPGYAQQPVRFDLPEWMDDGSDDADEEEAAA